MYTTMKTIQADSPTKTRLLESAERLMLSKGYAATTVEEICETAKLTKGSFFHYFDSKDDLGRAVLERFCVSAEQLHAACCGVERDPLKRVYNYIDATIKLSQDPTMSKGCLLGTFAQELCDGYPKIKRVCEQGFKSWADQFGKELAQAKARYAPKVSFEPRDVAEYFIAVVEGALILAKAHGDPKVVARMLRHFRAYVQSLFG